MSERREGIERRGLGMRVCVVVLGNFGRIIFDFLDIKINMN